MQVRERRSFEAVTGDVATRLRTICGRRDLGSIVKYGETPPRWTQYERERKDRVSTCHLRRRAYLVTLFLTSHLQNEFSGGLLRVDFSSLLRGGPELEA